MPRLAFTPAPALPLRFGRMKGFTVVDLMVALAIGASLAAVAWPGYAEQLRQGRRAEAIATIVQTSLALEHWRSTHAGYTDNVGQRDGLALSTSDLATSYLTQSGHHRVQVTVEPLSAASRYVVTAVPEAPHQDPGCASLSLLVEGGVVRRAVTPQGQLQRCWRP